MNAQPTMEVALKHALTLLGHSPVTVTLDIHLTMMECPVMVSSIYSKEKELRIFSRSSINYFLLQM